MNRTARAVIVPLLAATAALGPGARAAGQPEVSFIKPRSGATVVGLGQIRLRVEVPGGATARRVELFVDGLPLIELNAPPWEAGWNAGDGSTGHTLTAVLHLTDGREARAGVATTPLHVDQVARVELVDLYAVVRDREGSYANGLVQTDFRVYENGKPQTISRFSAGHRPLRVGIVLDTSLSMDKGDKLVKAREAALDFVRILQPEDQGTVIPFSDTVRVAQELTSDRDLLSAAIKGVTASGGTALYDAVWKTSRLLDHFEGRRVLVLLSDGRDESGSGLEPGSLHTLEEALDQALRSSVMVFAIGLGSALDRDFVRRWDPRTGLSQLDTNMSLAAVLQRMADSTGGRAEISVGPARLRKTYAEIAEDLRHQYSIAYTPAAQTRDGKWHELRLEVAGRDLEVVTRKGYYAPSPDK